MGNTCSCENICGIGEDASGPGVGEYQPTTANLAKQEDIVGAGNVAGEGGQGGQATISSYSFNYFEREIDELNKLPANLSRQVEDRPTFSFQSGAQYTGQWLGNKRHGAGVQSWPDGALYEGWSLNFI